MKNKYTNRFSLISLLALLLFSVSSCTYDYFEDETNYVVYVPKADMGVRTDTYKVDEVKILIYNTSDLERERYSEFPFMENPRTRVGNFHFKLFPGTHHIYCFSNTDRIEFSDNESYTTANFSLKKNDDGSYLTPNNILLDKIKRDIIFPGPLAEDTALYVHKYVGAIRVVFTKLSEINPLLADMSKIKRVETTVRNTGTKQMLAQIVDSIDTRSTRNSIDDFVFNTNQLIASPVVNGTTYDYGYSNNYFPSLDSNAENFSGEIPIELSIVFYSDENGGKENQIYSVTADVLDRKNGNAPVVLHMNQTITVLIDGRDLTVIELSNVEDWDGNIPDGEDNNPGGGLEL